MNRNQSHFRTALRLPILISTLSVIALLAGASAALAAPPAIGSAAPAFEFQGVDGALYSSAALYGETGVVVAWFPKAFTPG